MEIKQIHKTNLRINSILNESYNLKLWSYNTNKKMEITENKDLYLCKSYNTFIAIYLKTRKTLLINYTYFKSSVTTKKHYYAFLDYISEREFNTYYNKIEKDIKKIYLNVQDMQQLLNNYWNYGTLQQGLTATIIKQYELEKTHIYYYLNKENILNDIQLFKNIINTKSKDLGYIKGLKATARKTTELKTRNKHYIQLEYKTTELKQNFKTQITICITTDKSNKKIISVKPKLDAKIGLSYCNYKFNELQLFNGYDIGTY